MSEIKSILNKLLKLTEIKKYDEIREILASNEIRYIKGNLLEYYIRELYVGKGYLAERVGGANDRGADIIIYHPDAPQKVIIVIQAKNHANPLNYRKTLSEIRYFEEKGFCKYNCSNYVIISIAGFCKESYELQEDGVANISLQNWQDVVRLIDEYKSVPASKPMMELLPHNKRTFEEVKELFKTHKRVAVNQATGTGKRYITLSSMIDNFTSKALFISPSNLISEQITDTVPWVKENVRFITYSKAVRLTQEDINGLNIEYCYLDEYHRAGAPSWSKGVQRILDTYPDAYVLGTTATPIRYLDGYRDMNEELFDGVRTKELSLAEAIVRGILPTPTYVSALYSIDEESEIIRREIEESSVSEEIKNKLYLDLKGFEVNWIEKFGVSKILNKYIKKDSGKYIIFCSSSLHLNIMQCKVLGWFAEAGYNNVKISKMISSQGKKENEREFNEFKQRPRERYISLLFSVDMLNEGIHVSGVDGVILLRETISPILYFQQIGRAFSVDADKKPLILDFVNNLHNMKALDFINDIKFASKELKKKRERHGIPSKDLSNAIIVDESKGTVVMLKEIDSKIFLDWDKDFELYKLVHDGFVGLKIPKEDIYVYMNTKRGITRILKREKVTHITVDYIKKWVKLQNEKYYAGVLSERKIQKLNDIGFPWNYRKYLWNHFYLQLRKGLKRSSCTYTDFTYGEMSINGRTREWTEVQRIRYKKGIISTSNKRMLEEINFPWDAEEYFWRHNYIKVKNIIEKDKAEKKIYGDLDTNSKWVIEQIEKKEDGTLSSERINMLDSINFPWDYRTLYFLGKESRIKQAKLLSKDDEEFYSELWNYDRKWFLNVMEDVRNKKTDKYIINYFEKEKLVWDADKAKWIEYYTKLKITSRHGKGIFKNAAGRDYAYSQDMVSWFDDMRERYLNKTLESYKIEKLNELEFPWDKEEYDWSFKFKMLEANCIVNNRYNPNLEHIMCHIRKRKGKVYLENNWSEKQRNLFSEGLLPLHRVNHLKSVAFPFTEEEFEAAKEAFDGK